MRRRLFGNVFHLSVVALAVTELVLFACALLLATSMRLEPGAANGVVANGGYID